VIKISTNYLEHSGGTKFYEVVKLSDMAAGAHMVIKRWGKIAEKMGAGQTKVERYGDESEAADSVNEILRDKRKDKGAKGRYTDAVLNLGLHAYNGASAQDNDVMGIVRGHYQQRDVHESANYFFDLEKAAAPGDEVIDEPAPEPARPVERGDTWGSW